MKTPQEKYENDVHYHTLVDTMVNLIHKSQLTPIELVEAAAFSSIMHDNINVRDIPPICTIYTT